MANMHGISLETKGVIKLLDHQASVEEFTQQDGVHSTSIGLKELLIRKGYFRSHDTNHKASHSSSSSCSSSSSEAVTEIPKMILLILNEKLFRSEMFNNALLKSFGGII